MSIRNYLSIVLPLVLTTLVFAAEKKTEWETFKEDHDLFMLIKHKNKNEDRWVTFSLKDLPDDAHQVTWIEREDFLSKDKKVEVENIAPERQCNFFEQKVGSGDDRYNLLTIGLIQPTDQTYMFIMETYYKCVTAIIVPKEKTHQKPGVREQVKEYAAKFKDLITLAWYSIAGKKE